MSWDRYPSPEPPCVADRGVATQFVVMNGSEAIVVCDSLNAAIHELQAYLEQDIAAMPFWRRWYTKILIRVGMPVYIQDDERQYIFYIIQSRPM